MTSSASLAGRTEWLQSRLNEFQAKLMAAALREDEAENTMVVNELLEFIRMYDDSEAFESLTAAGHVKKYRSVFGLSVLRFIESIEARVFSDLMSLQDSRSEKMITHLGENRWGAYKGMKETLQMFDHANCRRFLLIGCGPVPDSLFCLHDCTKIENITGVDRNAKAVHMARQLVTAFGLDRIRIEERDAGDIDCGGYDMICCSAFITPRQDALARIISTANPGSIVIVRDPVFTGTLLFERMLQRLPPQLELLAESPSAMGRFMLKYYIFRVVTA